LPKYREKFFEKFFLLLHMIEPPNRSE